MLGDIGTLRLGEARVGSDNEFMETGKHTIHFVNEGLVGCGSMYGGKELDCKYF
jgi:hypothetical protein